MEAGAETDQYLRSQVVMSSHVMKMPPGAGLYGPPLALLGY